MGKACLALGKSYGTATEEVVAASRLAGALNIEERELMHDVGNARGRG